MSGTGWRMRKERLLIAIVFIGACISADSSSCPAAPQPDDPRCRERIAESDAASAVSVEAPPALDDSLEFSLPAVTTGADSTEVRIRLGSPDSVSFRVSDAPSETVTDWFYRGLTVKLDHRGKLFHAFVSDSTWPTRRGLRVGDSVARMQALYGTPDRNDTESFNYYPWTRSRAFSLGIVDAEGTITHIFLGRDE